MANLEILANTSRAADAADAAITQIDLSGYKYDIVPTYKMIEDMDDQVTLFQIQFLQAFGIDTGEYHPEIVSAVIEYLYDRYNTNPGIREMLEAHPLYKAQQAQANDDDRDDRDDDHGNTANDNSDMIFCMMFSFQLFDLFHTCLRHAKNKEDIPESLRDEIVECFRTMF
jgi:hypothetical protein